MNEYEGTHIFAHFVKKLGTDFWGKILKHIRIIRTITYDLQIKFDRMLSVFLFNVKNQKK